MARTQLAHRGLAGYYHLQESQSCILLEDYADFKTSPAILLAGTHAMASRGAWRKNTGRPRLQTWQID